MNNKNEHSIESTNNEFTWYDLTELESKLTSGERFSAIILWMKDNRVLELLEEFEKIFNPDFDFIQMRLIREKLSKNRGDTISVGEYVKRTNAKFLRLESGRNKRVFANLYITMFFVEWVRIDLQIWILKDFESLIDDEKKEEILNTISSPEQITNMKTGDINRLSDPEFFNKIIQKAGIEEYPL